METVPAALRFLSCGLSRSSDSWEAYYSSLIMTTGAKSLGPFLILIAHRNDL